MDFSQMDDQVVSLLIFAQNVQFPIHHYITFYLIYLPKYLQSFSFIAKYWACFLVNCEIFFLPLVIITISYLKIYSIISV